MQETAYPRHLPSPVSALSAPDLHGIGIRIGQPLGASPHLRAMLKGEGRCDMTLRVRKLLIVAVVGLMLLLSHALTIATGSIRQA